MLNLPLSEELQTAFSKAKGQSNVRSLKIKIENEMLVLSSTGTASSFSLDFNSFQKSLSSEEACYIAFRYKDTFATSPWALIMYTPDACPVKEKMMYASSFSYVRDVLGGEKYFSKLKRYEAPSDFVWNTFQNSVSDELEQDEGGGVSKPKVVDPNKPWNKRELAIHQLEKEEEQARQEFEQFAVEKSTVASGFSQVSFPLTHGAEEAIKNLQEGTCNWVQLSLDDPPTHIDSVKTATVASGELSRSLDPENPQFYVYRYSDAVFVLIYCCPETVSTSKGFSQTVKNRMVYSTCKATCAASIKELGIITLKKFDIREPNELTEAALTAHLNSKVAAMFTGTGLKGAPPTSTTTTTTHTSNRPANFDNTQFNNAPVFNRPGFNQPHNAPKNKAFTHQEGSLAGLMATTGTGTKKSLPKGVVIPPPGAYC